VASIRDPACVKTSAVGSLVCIRDPTCISSCTIFYKSKLVSCQVSILTVGADRIVDTGGTTMDDFLHGKRPAVDQLQVRIRQLQRISISPLVLRKQWDVTEADEKWCDETRCKRCWAAQPCTGRQLWVHSYMHARHRATTPNNKWSFINAVSTAWPHNMH